MMSVYCGSGDDGPATQHAQWFREEWEKTSKKLDRGKACIRFKKVEDLPLYVIGKAVKRASVKTYIQYCESARKASNEKSAAKRNSA